MHSNAFGGTNYNWRFASLHDQDGRFWSFHLQLPGFSLYLYSIGFGRIKYFPNTDATILLLYVNSHIDLNILYILSTPHLPVQEPGVTDRTDFLDLALLYSLMNFIGMVALLRFSEYGSFREEGADVGSSVKS